MTMPPAARYIVPTLRPFPIWRYGPTYDIITGRKVGQGWTPDQFGQREVSRTEAERLHGKGQPPR